MWILMGPIDVEELGELLQILGQEFTHGLRTRSDNSTKTEWHDRIS